MQCVSVDSLESVQCSMAEETCVSSLDSLCIHVSVLGVYDECVMLARESCVCVVSEVFQPDDMCGWSFVYQWTPCEYVPQCLESCVYMLC